MAKTPSAADMQDDLVLAAWDGDDSVKGKLVLACGGPVIHALRVRYRGISDTDLEDVFAEAVRRFWKWKDNYDPNKSKLFTMLYRIANNVARELRTGHLKAQRAQILEKGVDADFFKQLEAPEAVEETPDDVGGKPSQLQLALAECFKALPQLQQDILRRFAEAGIGGIEAAGVGVELGNTHKNGVPIPGGTIRTNRSRAWDSLESCAKRKGFDLKALGYTND